MARNFVAASSQYFQNNSAILTAMPLTIAAWAMTDTLGTLKILCTIGKNATTDYFRLEVQSTNVVRAVQAQNNTTVTAASSTTITTGTWFHACAVFASSTSRSAYLNGGSKGTNATANTPAAPDATLIGSNWNSGVPSTFWQGQIADVCIWNTALSDADVADLATGISPLTIKQSNVVGYWPLYGETPELSHVGASFPMTPVNGPTVAGIHPPLVLSRGLERHTASLMDPSAAELTGEITPTLA